MKAMETIAQTQTMKVSLEITLLDDKIAEFSKISPESPKTAKFALDKSLYI